MRLCVLHGRVQVLWWLAIEVLTVRSWYDAMFSTGFAPKLDQLLL